MKDKQSSYWSKIPSLSSSISVVSGSPSPSESVPSKVKVGSFVVLPSVSSPSSLVSFTSFSAISGFRAEFPLKVIEFSTPPESTSDWVTTYVALYVAVSPTNKFPTEDDWVADTNVGVAVIVRPRPLASVRVSTNVRF